MYNDIKALIFYIAVGTLIIWLAIIGAWIWLAIAVWYFIRPYYILWFLGFAIVAGSYIAWYIINTKEKWRIYNEKQNSIVKK